MAHASHLAFISEFAKSDVERAFPSFQPYRIIYNGVKDYSVMEQHFGEPHFAGQLPENGFLFHLSSLEPYKNAELLVEMMRYLRTVLTACRTMGQESGFAICGCGYASNVVVCLTA